MALLAPLLLALASSAHATLCPGGPAAGQVQIGVASGPGFAGAPICAPDPHAQAAATVSAYEHARREVEEAQANSRAVMQDNIEALTRSIEMLEAGRRSLQGIDPDTSITWLQHDHAKGWWVFPDLSTRTSAPGEFCNVMFASERGLIGLYGPGGDYRGAMLTFWGESVPRPEEMRLVQVSLEQNADGKVQTVRAYNYTEAGKFGVIALGVPSIEALLEAMEDELSFRVSIDGQQVVDTAWHSGLVARDQLNNCRSRKPR